MQRYYAQGFLTFDFGGLGRPESIYRFKLSFGGAVRPQHLYLLSGMQWVAKLGKLVNEQFSGAGPSGRQTKARAKIQRKPHI